MGKVLAQEEPCPVAGIMPWAPRIGGGGHDHRNQWSRLPEYAALMLIFRMLHPPAGSNPLIVMLGGASWSFLLTPTLLGSLIIVLVALLYNNFSHPSRYPTYWW